MAGKGAHGVGDLWQSLRDVVEVAGVDADLFADPVHLDPRSVELPLH